MAYILPRAVIVLIAWCTTCLVMTVVSTVAPTVFYVAAAVWSVVGLACFGYMQSLPDDADAQPAAVLVKARTSAE